MAIDKMVDSAKLDREMLATANALREKGKTEAEIPWEDEIGFEQAVLAIKGGADLNFEVIGGGTAPENPAENTIWVNTSAAIAGWSISATEPSTPDSGAVWIREDTEGFISFSTLSENEIGIHPLSVYQYESGAWSEKPASIYQQGEWIEIQQYVYRKGDQFERLTGGWESVVWKYTSSTSSSVPSLSLTGTQMQISTSGMTYYTGGAVKSKTMVDLTKYKTLKLKGTVNMNVYSMGYFRLFVSNNTSTPWQNATATQTAPTNNGTFEELELDVSGLSGYYYIGIGIYVDETDRYSISAQIDTISLVPKEDIS